MEKDIYILAIESSCDETAAAVVKNGREVLSNVISSQIELHKLYGGVVPEIASRKHVEKINPVIREALKEADIKLEDIDAIGVTYGPGLVGALLVGVAAAKAISYAKNIPLVGVHHIEGHISANYIENKELEPPFLGMVVSGGHTHLDSIVSHTVEAAKIYHMDKVALAGGVASNSALREAMKKRCSEEGLKFYYPSPILCTDNAAMIGCAAYYEYLAGTRHGLDLNAVPNLKIGQR